MMTKPSYTSGILTTQPVSFNLHTKTVFFVFNKNKVRLLATTTTTKYIFVVKIYESCLLQNTCSNKEQVFENARSRRL